jgi:hypothetical protein
VLCTSPGSLACPTPPVACQSGSLALLGFGC